MFPPAPKIGAYLKKLLILGRVSNLPTVWSNCLAGWLLGGRGSSAKFGLACLGTTLLYVGGMFLNDAFDEAFDRQHRSSRPVPSGAISVAAVWLWGWGWLAAGLACLSALGTTAAVIAVCLVSCIVLYDAVHKAFALSPILMAGCRFLVYLVAATSSIEGITGLVIWSGLALMAYIVGLSYLARGESLQAVARSWPCYFLATPILLALVVNAGGYLWLGLFFSSVEALWIIHCLRSIFGSSEPNIGKTVSGLLAGIVLVDLLAVAGGTLWIFLGLFAATLLFQRFIPAT